MVSPVNASTDTTRLEPVGDNDDKRRRVDEPGSPISTVAQEEVSRVSPVPFDSGTRNDEITVDVPSCVPSSIHGVGRSTRDRGCQTS